MNERTWHFEPLTRRVQRFVTDPSFIHSHRILLFFALLRRIRHRHRQTQTNPACKNDFANLFINPLGTPYIPDNTSNKQPANNTATQRPWLKSKVADEGTIRSHFALSHSLTVVRVFYERFVRTWATHALTVMSPRWRFNLFFLLAAATCSDLWI